MKYQRIRIFYSIIFMLILAMIFSIWGHKKILLRELRKPQKILGEIAEYNHQLYNLSDTLIKAYDTTRCGTILTGALSEVSSSGSNTEVAVLEDNFRGYQNIDSLLSLCDTVETTRLHAAVAFRYHRRVREIRTLMYRYDSMAIQINYHLKAYPQIFYINLFHLRLLPLFSMEKKDKIAG